MQTHVLKQAMAYFIAPKKTKKNRYVPHIPSQGNNIAEVFAHKQLKRGKHLLEQVEIIGKLEKNITI